MKRLGSEIHTIVPTVEGITETQFVFIQDGEMVGRVGVITSNRVAGIRQLFVGIESRHQKVGTKLVKNCIWAAESAGCEAISLTIAKCNAGVEIFYHQLGFRIAYQWPDGEILMTLPLPHLPG